MKTLALVACLAMPFQLVTADVQSDMDAGLPLDQVIANGQAAGLELHEIVSQAIAADPTKSEGIVSQALVAAAGDPNAHSAIITAGVNAGVDVDTMTSIAIASGVDPAVASLATAAGPASGPGPGTPPPALRRPNPPPALGGGGNASPS